MSRADLSGPAGLSADELALLAFTGDLAATEESPLGAAARGTDVALERGAQTLVDRGLADAGTLRPHRELARRLRVVADPDARVLLLERDADGTRRLLEYYERAGAFVPYALVEGLHTLGPPVDLETVLRQVTQRLPTRASRGDFVDFTVSASEYFALSLFAGQTCAAAREDSLAFHRARGRVAVEGAASPLGEGPPSSMYLEEEGTPIGQLFAHLPPPPRAPSWDSTVRSLVDKNVLAADGGRFKLRPYLRDLALALGTKHRTVLTRFDFGADDWIVRDATLIPVPGSLFIVRAMEADTIRIAEMTTEDLAETARYAISPEVAVETWVS
jgi:hypothetical protein